MLMNGNQKILLIVVAIVLVAMSLYPPFVFQGAHGIALNMGYDFIWDAPKPKGGTSGAVVNLGQLFFQMLIVAIVGGIGWLVCIRNEGGREDSRQEGWEVTKLTKMVALSPEILNAGLPTKMHFALCDALRDLHFALEEVLISLASFENTLPLRKKEAITKTMDSHAKLRDEGPSGGYDPEHEEEELKGIDGLFDRRIPLLTYYNLLTAAAAVMEFFIPMLGQVITGKKSEHRAMVVKLAQMADIDGSQYHNFCTVRNALVHRGGVAADEKEQKAAEALGFKLLCASKYSGGLSDGQQIIIDPETLEKRIEELYDFIVQLSVKAAQAGKGE